MITSAYRRLRLGWGRAVPDLADRRVFAAGAVVGAFVALTQVATLVKDLAVASIFGTSDDIDAFLIAFLLPSYAINVLSATIGSALIPTYVHTRAHLGADAARRLLGSVLSFTLVLLLTAGAVLAVAFPRILPLVASGFGPDKLALTTTLFLWLLPVLVLAAVVWIWGGVLNAEDSFAAPSAATLAVPLATLVAVVTFRHAGAFALAGGVVAGTTLQCIVLGIALKRRGVNLLPRWHGPTAEMRAVLGQYAPMVIGSLLTGGTAIVDSAMAAMLPAGSVATLNFGSKVVLGVVNIGTLALGTAVLPHFAGFTARGEWLQLRQSLRRYVRLVLAVTIPGTLLLLFLSRLVIRVLFERDAFTADDTSEVAMVQAALALQIPFVLAGTLYVRVLTSMRRAHVLMWGATITLPLNIVLNIIFSRLLGVAGIALSTSLVYAVSFLYLRTMALRRLPVQDDIATGTS